MKKIIAAIFLICGGIASAQSSNEVYLFKLSKTLRSGTVPTVAERNALFQAEKANTVDNFFSEKIQEYVHSSLFKFKLKTFIDEHFRLSADKNLNSTTIYGYSTLPPKGAYDYLVEKIVSDNLVWDSLLLAKNYTYEYFRFPTFYKTDRSFYKNILGLKQELDIVEDVNSSPYEGDTKTLIKEDVSFDPQDSRIAGVLTTPRFLTRYQNTALNKNRRRAAAIFRSFMCDDMVAAIPPKTADSEESDFGILLPATPAPSVGDTTEEKLRKELSKSDPHGSMPGCMACHYKLDPMGRTFALSAAGLSDKPSPGALIYNNNGHQVDIKVTGVGDLAQKITQQKEYVDCQVNLFWKWFIGKDFPKTEARHNELVAQFESVGRRPLDFISYLVRSPEFKAPPVLLTEAQILSRKAGKVLRRCFDCHKNQDQNEMMRTWDLSDFPFGKTDKEHSDAVGFIARALDIENDGANKRMPPKDSVWQLSPDEFEIMKNWVQQGAPDYTGKRQLP
ncbi:MAG: hypothetical protein ACXVCP_04865 [Bdellovibrio sp.]